MKFPAVPPSIEKLLNAKFSAGPLWLTNLLRHGALTDDQGRYLHWEDLRYKLAPAGMSSEEWWLATKLARSAASHDVSLRDKNGKKFVFCETPILKAALRHLDMNCGGELATDDFSLSRGEGKLHLVRSLAEEPFSSSLIEGAATTRQIAKKLIFENRQPRTKDERMVLNNYRAMEFVKARTQDPLSLEMLLELHRLVTQDTLPNPADAGRLRTSDDVQVVDDTDNEILHQPPLAAELPARLESVIRFANEKPADKDFVHPLLKAFILHFMLSYEHPFVDGNGRVARSLFYWSVLREGYWLMEYVSISSIIAQARIAYGKTFLYVETDGADLTYFLVYHAKILQDAIEQLKKFVVSKRAEVSAITHRISDDTFNHRQSWLLNEFVRRRLTTTTIGDYQARHGVSYLTARADLETLVAGNFLLKSKSGKTSLYRPAAHIEKRLANNPPNNTP